MNCSKKNERNSEYEWSMENIVHLENEWSLFIESHLVNKSNSENNMDS